MRAVLWSVKLAVAVAVLALAVQVGRRIGRSDDRASVGAAEATLGGSVSADSARARRAAILRHIAGSDSYLPAMLVESDSVLKRWRERTVRPLTVHIAAGTVPGSSREKEEAARRAFVRWERVGAIPVRFQFVSDPSQAEVRVGWTEHFPIRRAGQADITWDGDGWIIRAALTLATHTSDGLLLPTEAVYTVALHEIGHLLGLGHSDDPRDVMYPATDVHDITTRDRHTARLLYAVPPGSLKLGAAAP